MWGFILKNVGVYSEKCGGLFWDSKWFNEADKIGPKIYM